MTFPHPGVDAWESYKDGWKIKIRHIADEIEDRAAVMERAGDVKPDGDWRTKELLDKWAKELKLLILDE